VIPYNLKYDTRHKASGLDLWFEIKVDSTINIFEALDKFKSVNGILAVEGVAVLKPTSVEDGSFPVNDTYINRQWNLHHDGFNWVDGGIPTGSVGSDINLFNAWNITMGTPNVVVAIIDGGVDVSHPDLKDNMWINEAELNGKPGIDDDGNGYVDDTYGTDFATGQTVIPAESHATHVAGIVAAKANNGIGVAGVAGGKTANDGVRLMACRIYGDDDTDGGNVPAAFVYAADNGAVIAQCSWSFLNPNIKDQLMQDAIDYFIEFAGKDANGNPRPNTPMTGGLAVFAAGNLAMDKFYFPACYEKVYTVVATDIDKKLANYSNYGKWTDIAAPGGASNTASGAFGQIYSTVPRSGYAYMVGTSMACPHISGIAALVLSKYGNEKFTPEMLKHRISATANDISTENPSYTGKIGAGLADAYKALSVAIPDVNENLYYGTINLNKDQNGNWPTYKQTVRVLNSYGGQMVISGLNFSKSIYSAPGFIAGTTLNEGEFIDIEIMFQPNSISENRDELAIVYGGDYAGITTKTRLISEVTTSNRDGRDVLLSESFEYGSAGWSTIDMDGDSNNWKIVKNSNGFHLSHTGDRFIVSESGKYSNGVAVPYNPNNWLISPEIDLTTYSSTNFDALLSYWVRSVSEQYDNEHYKVLVSTDAIGNYPASSFTEVLLDERVKTSYGNTGYNYRELPLSNFVGQKLKFAFVHYDSQPGYWLIIDDVEVAAKTKEVTPKIVVKKVSPNYELTKGETYPVSAWVKNTGAKDASNIQITYQLSGKSPVQETIDILAVGDSVLHTFNQQFTADEDGLTSLEIKADCAEDITKTKNTFDANIWVNPYPTVQEWNFEDITSTWPSSIQRVTLDNCKISTALPSTAWGSSWPVNSERFLAAQLLQPIDPILGRMTAYSCSYFNPAGKADRWLIFPVAATQAEELYLKWVAASFAGNTESYEVLVSESDVPASFQSKAVYTNIPSTLSHQVINCSEYIGKPFYVAFRHTTDQGLILLLDNIRILAKNTSGIGTIDSEGFLIVPNPVSDAFTVQLPDRYNKTNTTAEILDVSGKIVKRIADVSVRCNVSELSPGVYIVILSDGINKNVSKLIKK
ncbi:MAG: S8 family serine peptidase, partial [Dysgonomonas sp.]